MKGNNSIRNDMIAATVSLIVLRAREIGAEDTIKELESIIKLNPLLAPDKNVDYKDAYYGILETTTLSCFKMSL